MEGTAELDTVGCGVLGGSALRLTFLPEEENSWEESSLIFRVRTSGNVFDSAGEENKVVDGWPNRRQSDVQNK